MNSIEFNTLLKHNGYTLLSQKNVPHGISYKLLNGATVTCFDNGRIQVQGKENIKKEVELALRATEPVEPTNIDSRRPHNKVFVVYGHDKESRDQLEAMLRRWRLDPLILDQIPSGGQTIIEKLENYTGQAHFGIVLATPDDVGYRREHEEEKAFRARQNVVLELGMLLAKLGREKVAILLKSQSEMERPSDIQGLIYHSYIDSVSETSLSLVKEMTAQGYNIDIKNI
jgi:predicted nucleotide-binding protein